MEEYKSEMTSEQVVKDWREMQESAKKEYIDSHKTEILDTDMTLFPKPKTSCNKCYGRGFEGAVTTPLAGKDIDLCRCIRNRVGKEGVECLTYGEFKTILAHCNSIYKLGRNYEDNPKVIQGSNQEDVNQGDAVEQGISNQVSQ